MGYRRVIPRDLFNESKLLKCMGQVSLLLHDGVGIVWPLELEHVGGGFTISQRDSDGGLTISNLGLYLKGKRIGYYTAYNSKDNYPLYFDDDADGGRILDENGGFSHEFITYLISQGVDNDTATG